MNPKHHTFTLSRTVRREGIASKEYVTTNDPDEALDYYYQGYEFESDLCDYDSCPACMRLCYYAGWGAYLYFALVETPQGRRLFSASYREDLEDLPGPNRVLRILGPALVGPRGYATELDAAKALADAAGIDFDDPSTWDSETGA